MTKLKRRTLLKSAASAALLSGAASVGLTGLASAQNRRGRRPNIIFILADDLGYGELGCYGQTRIQTPHLDRMAREGARFTDFYSASTVCAPARCALLTGLHTGHCTIRGNAKEISLNAGETTLATTLRGAGYATACIGKWGLGDPGSAGVPTKQGFDDFFGYLTHGHAHNYYPTYLYRGEERVMLRNQNPDEKPDGRGRSTVQIDYTPDLFLRESQKWIEKHKDGPFFLYFTPTIPHANNEARPVEMEVPDLGIYADKDWPEAEKRKAAMISRLDTHVGALLQTLKNLGIDNDTLVIFSSDNGPHREGAQPEFFDSSGPLRGIKRDLTEGGIRVPTIARWPRTIAAGTTAGHVAYFPDVLPTLAEIAGAPLQIRHDGLSFAPLLRGRANARKPFLYWEFYENGGSRAVRVDNWKAVTTTFDGPIQLFNLQTDIGETRDLAAQFPDIARRMKTIMDGQHVPTPTWNAEVARASLKPKPVSNPAPLEAVPTR